MRLRRPGIALFVVLVAAAISAGAQVGPPSPDPWLIVPGKSVGPITSLTTPLELMRTAGAGNVKEEMVGPGGDGEPELASVVRGSEPASSVVIFWNKLDATGHHPAADAHPEYISVCYASTPPAKKCKWHLADGITFGTSLKDLEKLNGGGFVLAGFGWDYEGVVMDWKSGKLAGLLEGCGGVGLALQPGEQVGVSGSHAAKLYEQVSGDGKFSSSLPAMQELNPVVFSINIKLDSGTDCAKD